VGKLYHLLSDGFCSLLDQPALQDSKTGDVIDFYGPCGEDPLGKDQVEDQKLIELHQRFKE
jgi:hypothetical protein